jgi:hemerythrin-like domain-containing protein
MGSMKTGAGRASSRKEFLKALLAGGFAAALPGAAAAAAPVLDGPGVEDATPLEDLMRDHGALNRLLLVYEEAHRRLAGGVELDPALVGRATGILQSFFEDFHQKLEERFVYPPLRAAGRLTELVDVLESQHTAGRRTTARIAELVKNGRSAGLQEPLAEYVRLFRPHEAREDTDVLLEFKRVVDENEYRELGQSFKDRERRSFGKAGFEGELAKIAGIEKALGINDLVQFTPRPEVP